MNLTLLVTDADSIRFCRTIILIEVLAMWDDIRTWVIGQEEFVFPKLALEIPSNDEYWAWRKLR